MADDEDILGGIPSNSSDDSSRYHSEDKSPSAFSSPSTTDNVESQDGVSDKPVFSLNYYRGRNQNWRQEANLARDQTESTFSEDRNRFSSDDATQPHEDFIRPRRTPRGRRSPSQERDYEDYDYDYEENKKDKKGLIILLVLVLILAIIFGALFMMYRHQQQQNTTTATTTNTTVYEAGITEGDFGESSTDSTTEMSDTESTESETVPEEDQTEKTKKPESQKKDNFVSLTKKKAKKKVARATTHRRRYTTHRRYYRRTTRHYRRTTRRHVQQRKTTRYHFTTQAFRRIRTYRYR